MLLKKIAVLSIIFSSLVSASDMKITSTKMIVSKDTKTQTYIGDVKVSFATDNKPIIKSTSVQFINGKTVMEGNVEMFFNNALAKADKITVSFTNNQVIAEMEQVTVVRK